jgi:NAD(P)-dependent dehydrogenase (short-subunit alcohol dehydrogenase family)
MSRVVVISGGGTGIGRAVAEIFAADGDDVVIIGRRVSTVSRGTARGAWPSWQAASRPVRAKELGQPQISLPGQAVGADQGVLLDGLRPAPWLCPQPHGAN